MKVNKVKKVRKGVQVYISEFGFREPYQVIVEGEFLNESLKHRFNLKEKLSKYFDGQVTLMITKCTVQDLRNLGEDYLAAVVAAKRLIRRNCPHKEAIKGDECIKQIIGDENKHRYFVACISPELNKQMNKVPGVPIVTLYRRNLLLNPLSEASKKKLDMIVKDKLMPSNLELERLKLVTGVDLDALKAPVLPLHRRKKPKAPNPLSVLKKKKRPKNQASKDKPKVKPALSKAAVPAASSDGVGIENPPETTLSNVDKKPKRKRRRSKKKSGTLSDQSSVNPSVTTDNDGSDSEPNKRRRNNNESN